MLQIQKDGRLSRTGSTEDNPGQSKETIELPVDLLAQQSDLIDRVFTFVFDTLGLQTIELRIRPPATEVRNRI
jgi:hypothetical protein